MGIINWQLMREPMNWIVILAMLIISGFAISLLADAVNFGNGATENG